MWTVTLPDGTKGSTPKFANAYRFAKHFPGSRMSFRSNSIKDLKFEA